MQAALGSGAEVGAFGVATVGKLVEMSEVVGTGRGRETTVYWVAAETKCKAEEEQFLSGGAREWEWGVVIKSDEHRKSGKSHGRQKSCAIPLCPGK